MFCLYIYIYFAINLSIIIFDMHVNINIPLICYFICERKIGNIHDFTQFEAEFLLCVVHVQAPIACVIALLLHVP